VLRAHLKRIGARRSLAAVLLAVAACSRHKSATDTATAAGQVAPDSAAPAVAVTTEVAPGVVVTTVAKPGEAIYLADGSGRAMYVLDAAPTDTSSWKPVPGTSAPTTTDTSVKSTMLGTTTNANGTKQATYNGKPLYYYQGDTGPNDKNGNNKSAGGTTGHLVNPATGSAAKR
jgi:predicted lipoprotein with Yx(FWY)xxD motif